MDTTVEHQIDRSGVAGLDRRSILVGGLIAGAGLVLAGCQSNKAEDYAGTFGPPIDKTPVGRSDGGGGGNERAPTGTARAPSGVIPRREWTSAGVVTSLANPLGKVTRVTVHHDAIHSEDIRSKSDAARRLASIREAHLKQDWADIGYHYIIDPQGRVWEGRPIRYQGAHVKFNNENNLGIMVMGNFDEQRPTSAALATLDAFVSDRMKAYGVPVGRVYTHQEIRPTACPGRNLQAYMVQTRAGGRMANA